MSMIDIVLAPALRQVIFHVADQKDCNFDTIYFNFKSEDLH